MRAGITIALLGAATALSGCIPRADPPDRDRPPVYDRAAPAPRYRQPDTRPSVQDTREDRPVVGRPDRRGVSALPAPRPAWEARPVAPDAAMVEPSTYVVRPGDTIGRIANQTGASVEAIAGANALQPPYPVRLGQRLTIPGGRYHLVRPGQTGIAIARAYGVEWSRIVAANGLQEPYTLRVGQRVLIPGTAHRRQPPSTLAERALPHSGSTSTTS